MTKITPIIDWSTLNKSGHYETTYDADGSASENPYVMGTVGELNAQAKHPTTGETVPGVFAYTPSEGTEVTQSQIIQAVFTPNDPETFNTAFKQVSFMVQRVIKTAKKPMKMFGAYVESFSSGMSFGAQGGSCQLSIVEDPDDDESIFDPPEVGTACYFKYEGFFFGGVFQRYTYNESTSGRKYDVILESPGGKILNGANVILADFDGTSYNYGGNNTFNHGYGKAANPLFVNFANATAEFPPALSNPIFSNAQGMRNIFNPLAHEENYYLGGERNDLVRQADSGFFGDAKTNSAGFPARRLLDILELMTQQKSNFGDKIYFGQSEYEIDLSQIKDVPENFRIANQTTNITSIIEECCELLQYSYILTIEPKLGIDSIEEDGGDIIKDPIIRVKTIDRTQQPTPGMVQDLIDQEKDKGLESKLVSYSVGKELSDEVVQKLIVGAQASRYIINDVPGMIPVWGKTADGLWLLQKSAFSDCPIGMPLAYDPDAPVDVIVSASNLSLFYRATIDELRMATAGKPSWLAFKAFQSVANGTWENDPWIADFEFTQEILNLAANGTAGPLIFASTSYKTAQAAFNPSGQRVASAGNELVDNIFQAVQSCANNFFGQVFLSTIPEEPGGRSNNIKYRNDRPQNLNQNITDQIPAWEPSSSAWSEDKPVDDLIFYENDGKLKMMAVWPASDSADYTALGSDYGIYNYRGGVGIASPKASYSSDFVYWTDFRDAQGNTCGFDLNNNGLAGVVISSNAQVKVVDQWTGPRMGLIFLANKFFGINIPEQNLIGFSQGLANIEVPPKIVPPSLFGLPQKSNKYSWGPWFGFGTVNGKSEVVFDTSLAPESFGSADTMNDMGIAYVKAGNAEVIDNESGSLRLAEPPRYNLAEKFASAGPYVTNIDGNIDTGGSYTTYKFNTWTPNFGKLAKYNADRLSRIYKDTLASLKNVRDKLSKKPISTTASRIARGTKNEKDERMKRNRDNGTSVGFNMYNGGGASGLPNRFFQGTVSDLNDAFASSVNKYSTSFNCSNEQIFSPFEVKKQKGSSGVPSLVSASVTGETGNFEKNSIVPSVEELDPYFPKKFYDPSDDGSEFLANSDYFAVINEVGGGPSSDLQLRKLDDARQVTTIRSIGYKYPYVLSGVGFDLANNPVPGKSDDITVFDQDASDDRTAWKTGPVKLMWDKERKVWAGGHDILVGTLTTDITPPSDPLNPTTFTVNVLRKISDSKGAGALEDKGETVTCYNRDTDFSLSAQGNPFITIQRINYEWQPFKNSVPGGGISRIQFVTLGKISNRIVNAKVIRSLNTDVEVGSMIPLYDPFNLWSDIEPDATGWAYYAKEFARWEIEESSLPVKEVTAILDHCLYANVEEGTAFIPVISTFPEVSNRTSYPDVDKIPDGEASVTDLGATVIKFKNIHKLDGIKGSPCVLRRVTDLQLSDPENQVVPKSRSTTNVHWEIVQVSQRIARHISVNIIPQSAGNAPIIKPSGFFDGESPENPCGIEIDCEICNDCADGKGYAFFANKKGSKDEKADYKVYSTESAGLGKSFDIEAVEKITEFKYTEECGLQLRASRNKFKGFCKEQISSILLTTEPTLEPVTVLTNVSLNPLDEGEEPTTGGSNFDLFPGYTGEICFDANTVYVCKTSAASPPECIPFCCDYETPDPPPDESCSECEHCRDTLGNVDGWRLTGLGFSAVPMPRCKWARGAGGLGEGGANLLGETGCTRKYRWIWTVSEGDDVTNMPPNGAEGQGPWSLTTEVTITRSSGQYTVEFAEIDVPITNADEEQIALCPAITNSTLTFRDADNNCAFEGEINPQAPAPGNDNQNHNQLEEGERLSLQTSSCPPNPANQL